MLCRKLLRRAGTCLDAQAQELKGAVNAIPAKLHQEDASGWTMEEKILLAQCALFALTAAVSITTLAVTVSNRRDLEARIADLEARFGTTNWGQNNRMTDLEARVTALENIDQTTEAETLEESEGL